MEYGRFYFGIPEINNGAEISLEDYEVEKDYEEYEKNLDDADFGMVRLSIGLYNTMEEAKKIIDEYLRG